MIRLAKFICNFKMKKAKLTGHLKKIKYFLDIFLMTFIDTISRCFQIEIYPHEPKYQSLLATSKLRIEFKHNYYKLYLISKEENFNSKSYEIKSKSMVL